MCVYMHIYIYMCALSFKIFQFLGGVGASYPKRLRTKQRPVLALKMVQGERLVRQPSESDGFGESSTWKEAHQVCTKLQGKQP